MERIDFPQSDTILIPMPTSKPRNDSEFDSRLDDMVKLVHTKTGQRFGFNLNTTHSSKAFHISSSSRYISDIGGNINFTPFDEPVPAKVILVDDVVTTGAHFIACGNKIRHRHPCVFVLGLFLAKTIWESGPDNEGNNLR
jgi:predicted amidophosphoribosyltransferase